MNAPPLKAADGPLRIGRYRWPARLVMSSPVCVGRQAAGAAGTCQRTDHAASRRGFSASSRTASASWRKRARDVHGPLLFATDAAASTRVDENKKRPGRERAALIRAGCRDRWRRQLLCSMEAEQVGRIAWTRAGDAFPRAAEAAGCRLQSNLKLEMMRRTATTAVCNCAIHCVFSDKTGRQNPMTVCTNEGAFRILNYLSFCVEFLRCQLYVISIVV